MKRLIILVPAYNVASQLASVIERIPKSIWQRNPRVIIIDDGSSDATGDVVNRLVRKYHQVQVIRKRENQGFARALKTGFRFALTHGADLVVTLHGDGQYLPEEMERLLKPLEQGEAEIVHGSRILGGGARSGGMPLYKYLGNRLLTTLENWIYGTSFSEFHSGYLAYTRKALSTIPYQKLSNTYHLDGEMLFMGHCKGLSIVEVPISTRYASQGSHVAPFTYGLDVIRILGKYLLGGYNL